MPSYLTTPNPNTFEQQLGRAYQSIRRQSIKHRSPWQGWLPDMDPHLLPPNACSYSRGLVARPDPSSHGEVLMPDDGYDAVDVDNLPLGSDATHAITLICELPRTNAAGEETGLFVRTIVTIVAGDEAGVEAEMYRTVGGVWTLVPYVGVAGDEPEGDRDALFDYAVMPSGATNRLQGGGAVNQPVVVCCNGVDRVLIYPEDDVGAAGQHSYGILTDSPVDFIAKTCEAFNGRIYYGNTTEASVHYPQRIRRTALFTADPLIATIGSGAMDIREFSGSLLRLEKLGSIMAAYFEDGTAFIRSTNVATAPDAYTVLKEHRGLLSTHSVVPMGEQQHFGIFDDGWYILDTSGRFTEVGISNIQGSNVYKWKRTFYENLDIENRHRLFVSYDGNFVRIVYPRVGVDDAEEVWIYDPRSDRVWVEDYGDGNYITVFGEASVQIAVALTWDSTAAEYAAVGGDSWSTIIGSWASMGDKFGLKALLHGNIAGHVMIHNADRITRYNSMTGNADFPSYEFHSVKSALGEPRLLKTAKQLWVEYIHTSSSDMTVRIVGNPNRPDGTPHDPEEYTIDLTPINRQPGEILTAKQHFDFTDTELGFEVAGTSPILIRSFETDYYLKLQEERD